MLWEVSILSVWQIKRPPVFLQRKGRPFVLLLKETQRFTDRLTVYLYRDAFLAQCKYTTYEMILLVTKGNTFIWLNATLYVRITHVKFCKYKMSLLIPDPLFMYLLFCEKYHFFYNCFAEIDKGTNKTCRDGGKKCQCNKTSVAIICNRMLLNILLQ